MLGQRELRYHLEMDFNRVPVTTGLEKIPVTNWISISECQLQLDLTSNTNNK